MIPIILIILPILAKNVISHAEIVKLVQFTQQIIIVRHVELIEFLFKRILYKYLMEEESF